MNEENQKTERKFPCLIVLFIVIFLILLIFVFTFIFMHGCDDSGKSKQPETSGEKFSFDDFYHADGGDWKLESTIHLLKERKYVSGDRELKEYLVYEAKPGETVRIKKSLQRWKQIEVIKDGKTVATGWVDANRKSAEKLP